MRAPTRREDVSDLIREAGGISAPPHHFTHFLSRSLVHRALVLSRDTISAFFPCHDWPGTMRDFQQRREQEPGQEEWTAFVVASVGVTVAHLWAHMPELTKDEAIEVVNHCAMYARAYIAKVSADDEVTFNRREFLEWIAGIGSLRMRRHHHFLVSDRD